MRLFVLCQGLPHPTVGASRVIYYHYLRGLVNAGFDVHLLILDEGPSQRAAAEVTEFVRSFEGRGAFTADYLTGFPQFTHRLNGIDIDAKLVARAAEKIAAFGADLVLCFDWVAAAVALGARPPRVVWLGDLQFQTLYWHTHFSLQEGSWRYDRLLMLPLRIRQITRFYQRILRGTKIVVSSHSSEKHLAMLGLPSDFLPYPWPIPAASAPLPPKAKLPTFLFSGTLGALGSRAAFHKLFCDIHPRACAAFGPRGFEILMTGLGQLPGWVTREIKTRPEIRFLGYVADLASVMSTCSAFIAPIDVPVGNRSRILTCMGAGLPVIAHPNTALGNPLLRDGETCVLTDDSEVFVRRMVELAGDPMRARELAERARAAYERQYSPEVANAALVSYLSLAAYGR